MRVRGGRGILFSDTREGGKLKLEGGGVRGDSGGMGDENLLHRQ